MYPYYCLSFSASLGLPLLQYFELIYPSTLQVYQWTQRCPVELFSCFSTGFGVEAALRVSGQVSLAFFNPEHSHSLSWSFTTLTCLKNRVHSLPF